MNDWSDPLAVWDGRPTDDAEPFDMPGIDDYRGGEVLDDAELHVPMVDTSEDCPELVEALNRFYEDPMTDAVGMAGEMSGLVVKMHIAKHGCHGFGVLE